MRPADIPDVQYNVATWLSDRPDLNRTDRRADQSGRRASTMKSSKAPSNRGTADLFNAERIIVVRPVFHRAEGTDKITFGYPENDLFRIAAELTADTATGRPLLTYRLTAKTGGWYSVGFTGFAGRDPKRTDEIWQPLIWQEKRFPDKSYLTLAFRCPVPSAFVTYRNATYGILAHPAEFPFDPLPTAANSRFGIAVRDRQGLGLADAVRPGSGRHRLRNGSGRGTRLFRTALRRAGRHHGCAPKCRRESVRLHRQPEQCARFAQRDDRKHDLLRTRPLQPFSGQGKGLHLCDGRSGRGEKRFESQSAGNRRPERQPDDASRKGASGIRIRAFAREAALLRRFDAEPSSTLRGA